MNKRLRILSIIVMSYMLAALCWWAVLLHRKNVQVFQLESKLLQEQYINNLGIPSVDVTTLPEFEQLQMNYDRTMMMIVSEAIVFGVVLIIGIYFINRAFNKELAIAQKQKNFLLSVTHELKSPLSSISLILDTFIKRDLPREKIAELSQDALQESTRLNELFNKMLLATRLGSTYKFQKVETDVSALVKEVVEKFQKINTDVHLTYNLEPGVIKVLDAEAWHSVIINLLENAKKYSKLSPKIAVQLKTSKEKMVLTIADNGLGIPSSEKAKVFEQFYRVGSEETRTSKGTGLGLYIVKKIVDDHQGKIKVEDNTGGGSRFEIVV